MLEMDPPAGRRGRGLHLTERGQRAIQSAFPIWRSTQERVETALGDESTSTFDRLLDSAEKLFAAA
jgi:DNA-binding MarR family transcriptional regulator